MPLLDELRELIETHYDLSQAKPIDPKAVNTADQAIRQKIEECVRENNGTSAVSNQFNADIHVFLNNTVALKVKKSITRTNVNISTYIMGHCSADTIQRLLWLKQLWQEVGVLAADYKKPEWNSAIKNNLSLSSADKKRIQGQLVLQFKSLDVDSSEKNLLPSTDAERRKRAQSTLDDPELLDDTNLDKQPSRLSRVFSAIGNHFAKYWRVWVGALVTGFVLSLIFSPLGPIVFAGLPLIGGALAAAAAWAGAGAHIVAGVLAAIGAGAVIGTLDYVVGGILWTVGMALKFIPGMRTLAYGCAEALNWMVGVFTKVLHAMMHPGATFKTKNVALKAVWVVLGFLASLLAFIEVAVVATVTLPFIALGELANGMRSAGKSLATPRSANAAEAKKGADALDVEEEMQPKATPNGYIPLEPITGLAAIVQRAEARCQDPIRGFNDRPAPVASK